MGIKKDWVEARKEHEAEKDISWLSLVYLASLVFWLLLLSAIVQLTKGVVMKVISLVVIGLIIILVAIMFLLPRQFLREADRFVGFFCQHPLWGTLILIIPYSGINLIALYSGIRDILSLLFLNGFSLYTLYIWHITRKKVIQ